MGWRLYVGSNCPPIELRCNEVTPQINIVRVLRLANVLKASNIVLEETDAHYATCSVEYGSRRGAHRIEIAL